MFVPSFGLQHRSGILACRPHKSSDGAQPERHCSLFWRLERRARRKLEERQPQVTHLDEEAVERRLVTDGTGQQRRAISLVRDREVLKPLLPEGVQVPLHANDVSHTLVLRLDDISSSGKKDTLRAGGTQSPKGYQKATFERREEQPDEGSQKATMHDGRDGAILTMPRLWVRCEERAQSNERARARAMACVRFSAPSLLKILATCFLAVASETTSWVAISWLEAPSASSCKTRRSRGVSCARRPAGSASCFACAGRLARSRVRT